MRGTVKAKDEMERLFREGRRSSSFLTTVLVLPSPKGVQEGRIGFIAGKKLGVAPLRNRCKRVLREVARELGGPWPGYDVVFVAKRKAASINHARALKVIGGQIEEMGIIDGYH